MDCWKKLFSKGKEKRPPDAFFKKLFVFVTNIKTKNVIEKNEISVFHSKEIVFLQFYKFFQLTRTMKKVFQYYAFFLLKTMSFDL